MTGAWRTRPGGVHVWPADEPFPEPADEELTPYGLVLPTRPGCGVPGVGRKYHKAANEPTCQICKEAEAAYKRARRERKRAS